MHFISWPKAEKWQASRLGVVQAFKSVLWSDTSSTLNRSLLKPTLREASRRLKAGKLTRNRYLLDNK